MEHNEILVSSTERMYSPSTREVIFGPTMDWINDNADAFVGYWHCEFMDEPTVRDDAIAAAWEKYYREHIKDNPDAEWEDYQRFFLEYDNPDWITWECDFHGIACGPISFTVIYVVKADTVIEEDPDYEEE